MDGPVQYLHFGFMLISLAKAFVVRSLGRLPKQCTFTLRLGHQGSCLDLLGQESDPSAITETVRKQYRESLF